MENLVIKNDHLSEIAQSGSDHFVSLDRDSINDKWSHRTTSSDMGNMKFIFQISTQSFYSTKNKTITFIIPNDDAISENKALDDNDDDFGYLDYESDDNVGQNELNEVEMDNELSFLSSSGSSNETSKWKKEGCYCCLPLGDP